MFPAGWRSKAPWPHIGWFRCQCTGQESRQSIPYHVRRPDRLHHARPSWRPLPITSNTYWRNCNGPWTRYPESARFNRHACLGWRTLTGVSSWMMALVVPLLCRANSPSICESQRQRSKSCTGSSAWPVTRVLTMCFRSGVGRAIEHI